MYISGVYAPKHIHDRLCGVMLTNHHDQDSAQLHMCINGYDTVTQKPHFPPKNCKPGPQVESESSLGCMFWRQLLDLNWAVTQQSAGREKEVQGKC